MVTGCSIGEVRGGDVTSSGRVVSLIEGDDKGDEVDEELNAVLKGGELVSAFWAWVVGGEDDGDEE